MILCYTFHCLYSSRLILEYSKQPEYKSLVTEEVVMFLCKTYEESIIPPLLVRLIEWYLIVYLYTLPIILSTPFLYKAVACVSYIVGSHSPHSSTSMSWISLSLSYQHWVLLRVSFIHVLRIKLTSWLRHWVSYTKLYESSVVHALLCFYCVIVIQQCLALFTWHLIWGWSSAPHKSMFTSLQHLLRSILYTRPY